MNRQLFCFTLFLLVCLSVPAITAAQVEISAVPSANSPAVGNTIEVSINIAGGSNVAGYEFRLTFNSTELEFISVENSDYLPGDPFVPELEPRDGSVKFAAVALTGTGEGDGTLAIARFKVLAETETTIGLEDVIIGDRPGQPIQIASITGATITPIAAGSEVEYLLSIPAGISLIHVPLKVTAVEGVAKNIISISDLYDALGGASTIDFLITYNSQTQTWLSYFGPSDKRGSADVALTDDKGIIAGLRVPTSVRLRGETLGTNGSSTITLTLGLNLVGMPLRNSRIRRVSDLFALEGIRDNVPVIILTDSREFKAVGRADDPGDIEIVGGQSFIMTALRAATVTISGDGWTNTSGTATAPPMAITGIEVDDITPILALRGSIFDDGRGLSRTGFRVSVKNRSTGRTIATVTGGEHLTRPDTWESDVALNSDLIGRVGYQLADVDLETMRAAMIGDILEISAQSPDPLIRVEPLQYTVTVEDVRQSWIQLPALVAYEIPAETDLLRNYPNPFNPETWIPYQLAHAADVTLTIYDTKGVFVRQLDLGYQGPGYYTNKARAAYWDGRNHLGELVGSGVYFYQLRVESSQSGTGAGNYSAMRKMVILK